MHFETEQQNQDRPNRGIGKYFKTTAAVQYRAVLRTRDLKEALFSIQYTPNPTKRPKPTPL